MTVNPARNAPAPVAPSSARPAASTTKPPESAGSAATPAAASGPSVNASGQVVGQVINTKA